MLVKDGFLYVTCGSQNNVDLTPVRSVMKRFDLKSQIPNGGFDWNNGEIFALGLRNEAGITIGPDNEIWSFAKS